MGRTVRDIRLETRAARSRLSIRAEPYWRVIHEGAHLGYYRGSRTGKWVARYRTPGGASKGYVKRTLGEADDVADADGVQFFDFRQAQYKARAWFEEVSLGRATPSSYTVADALDDYMKGFRGRSVAATRSRVEAIIKPALGTLEVAALTRKIVADWHAERAASPARLRTSSRTKIPNCRPLEGEDAIRQRKSTANRDLTVLKAALNRAAENRAGLPLDAWRGVRPFANVDRAKLRYLKEDEARRLVNATTPQFRPMVQAALLTGARYGELRNAKVQDFDAAAGVLWLRETKSGGPRVAYLEEEGVRLLSRACAGKGPAAWIFSRPDGQRWGASQQARPLAEAWRNAKLEPTTFHDLRRTYGARLATQGVPLAVIAEALGHADERITRRHYAHLSPSYIATTVRQTVAGLGIVARDNVVQFEGERQRG